VYQYQATVAYVVDGDTVDFNADLGFRVWRKDRFRLYGIDTPERGQLGWAEATAELKRLLPLGDVVILNTHMDKTDKYGRWLAEVTNSAGVDVCKAMVEGGFAVVRFW